MDVVIASDHAAREMTLELGRRLHEGGRRVTELPAGDGRSDYPSRAEEVARAVVEGRYDRGILLCGTGVGMAIAANKVAGVRAVVCSEPYSALMSREHNDTNILALGARVIGVELAQMIAETWLDAEFQGRRHQERVAMISALEAREIGTPRDRP
ncbi:ribose 5-phosphate isomerase B [Microbacterium sp.]|uniref:ribose 5-phosphate isomerase B n=1 Tax=Microbacterium sp. TaxID=51671 RepID=UPI0039E46874